MRRIVDALSLLLLVAGCGPAFRSWDPEPPPSPPPRQTSASPVDADSYVVREGDTLYSIAWRHGVDHRELARWNDLGDGSLIFPGQRLRLRPREGAASARRSAPPFAAPRSTPPRRDAPPRWVWPADGPVVAGYGDSRSVGKGIDIGGSYGSTVRAAADGKVVYTGGGLISYGQLIIVKHNNTYLSAYGHNSALYVAEGDTVMAGQRIAAMGEGPGKRPVLHFEIRLDGEPVDPRLYLPKRDR